MNGKRQGLWTMKGFVAAAALALTLFVLAARPSVASDPLEAEGIVDNARVTLNNFMDDSNYSWFHSQLKKAKGDVTTDFISFAKSKGLYAGINLEGSILTVRDGLNEGFYGKDVRPVEIIVFKKASNKMADELRAGLAKAAH